MSDVPNDRIRLDNGPILESPVLETPVPVVPTEIPAHEAERPTPHKQPRVYRIPNSTIIVGILQWALVVGSVVLLGLLWRHAPALPKAPTWHPGRDSIGIAIGALVAGSLAWRMAFRAVRVILTIVVLAGIAWLFWHFY